MSNSTGTWSYHGLQTELVKQKLKLFPFLIQLEFLPFPGLPKLQYIVQIMTPTLTTKNVHTEVQHCPKGLHMRFNSRINEMLIVGGSCA